MDLLCWLFRVLTTRGRGTSLKIIRIFFGPDPTVPYPLSILVRTKVGPPIIKKLPHLYEEPDSNMLRLQMVIKTVPQNMNESFPRSSLSFVYCST